MAEEKVGCLAAVGLHGLRDAGFKRVRNFGHFDHPITSAPAIPSDYIRQGLRTAIEKRTFPALAAIVARNDLMLTMYRRWLTFRCRIPGRLHSFLAEKSA